MTTRPSWDKTYMDMCDILAQRSTCLRIQTASVIVKDNIIVSVGYNGVVSGQDHCSDYWRNVYESDITTYSSFDGFLKSDFFYTHHHEWSNCNELHGEMNAILFAGKNGISLRDSTIYTIYSPCINCAKAILTAGIVKVVYKNVYKRSTTGIEFLQNHGISISEIEKN